VEEGHPLPALGKKVPKSSPKPKRNGRSGTPKTSAKGKRKFGKKGKKR
jgi:hypothetical protein